MCQLPSNPLQTLLEVSELFQEFLKHASIDGFVESWCLEIRLRSSARAIPSDLPVDCMHHLIALHSLHYFISKRLDERHHELTMECCSCGWEVSHIPRFQHSEISRYTPGTVIRWSQGECHILLAPSIEYDSLNQNIGVEHLSEAEELQKEADNEKVVEGISIKKQLVPEEDLPPRSGVIQSIDQCTPCPEKEAECACSPPEEESGVEDSTKELPDESVAQESQYFIKHQHFCEEDTDCAAHGLSELDTVNEQDIEEKLERGAESPLWLHQPRSECLEGPSTENTYVNDASEDDDEEHSRMLIINEDDNSQDTIVPPPDPSTTHAFTFHHVLPLTTENVRSLPPGEKRPLPAPSTRKEEEQDSREDENDDDDSSSVSSSSSSSSSSTSSSSSSDDDDRINFKNRVEQAAQAAREAAASAAATTASSFLECPPISGTYSVQENVTYASAPANIFHSPRSTLGVITEEHHNTTFATYRHPDDIQAAQGLAALGKGHEFPLEEDPLPLNIGRAPMKMTTTSKIAQKLLQNKNVNVHRVGQKSSFQCGVCGKIFSRFYKALEHQISHTGEKPWQCESCEKKFSKYHSMQKHHRAKHTPAHLQEFKCYVCDKNFGSHSILQMHLVTHATLKPFSCSVCGHTFATKFTKDAHEARHTGNRPWQCNVCPKAFITKYKLRAHMKAHTGELFCSICNCTFTSQDAFTRHKRRHETQKESVSADRKKNSPQRQKIPISKGQTLLPKDASFESYTAAVPSQFRCQMCNKAFAKSTDLSHHLPSCNAIAYCPPNIHTGMPGSSLLPGNGGSQTLNIHPPDPASHDPHHLHHQTLSSTTPLMTCMLVEEKKLSQFTPATENIEVLDRRSYLMNNLPTQSMTCVAPYQLQEMVIHTSSNPVADSLPDYLSEVAFGTASDNPSAIIFQPANEQG